MCPFRRTSKLTTVSTGLASVPNADRSQFCPTRCADAHTLSSAESAAGARGCSAGAAAAGIRLAGDLGPGFRFRVLGTGAGRNGRFFLLPGPALARRLLLELDLFRRGLRGRLLPAPGPGRGLGLRRGRSLYFGGHCRFVHAGPASQIRRQADGDQVSTLASSHPGGSADDLHRWKQIGHEGGGQEEDRMSHRRERKWT